MKFQHGKYQNVKYQNGLSSMSTLLIIVLLFFLGGYYFSTQVQKKLELAGEYDEGAVASGVDASSDNTAGDVYESLVNLSADLISNDSAESSSIAKPGPGLDHSWPPIVGEEFPDLYLNTNKGKRHLSEFKGKVILVEPVGMNCAACNAFNGGHIVGGYKGTVPQQGVAPIEELLNRYAGIGIDDPDLILVHLLLYNTELKTPKPEDANNWADHFGWQDKENVFVMVGDSRYTTKASYDMIPGFFLLDKDFILRSDSTGHYPKNSLGNHLLPMIPELIGEIHAMDGPTIPFVPAMSSGQSRHDAVRPKRHIR